MLAALRARFPLVEAKSYPITPAVVEQRREAAIVHGAGSEARVKDAARAQKRALLRKMGRRSRDLDPVGWVLIDLLSRSLAKLAILDRYYAETGVVREDGSGSPTLPLYVSMLNSARLTASRLAEHLARQGAPVTETLESYIEANYSPRVANGDSGADE